MRGKMTGALWLRGLKNAIMVSVVSTAFLVPLAFLISVLRQESFGDSIVSAFLIFLVATLSWGIFAWIRDKKGAGAVLLDCGRHPVGWVFLLNGGLFLWVGYESGYSVFTRGSGYSTFIGISIAVVFAIYWVLMSLGRLQIRENGIWCYWGLLRWNRIESYEWQGKRDCTLMFRAKTRIPFLGKGGVPFPEEHRPEVTSLIEKHVAANS